MPNWKVPSRAMPRPAGQSPFRVKGHGLRARLDVYDRVVPGGRRAVLDAIDDADVRAYLSGPILAASWYDLFAHAYLDIVAAELRKMPASESVSSASALQAQADAKGIYAMLLRLVSPHVLVSKLGAISSQYFDHGAVEVERLDATHARMTRVGIANQLYWWWGAILEGYVHALFGLAGARDVQIHCGVLRSDALDDPLGIGRFAVDVRWA
ncbi:hypothetical protein [Sandaracinus amylolyticus]|uniref:hypothetical protein n=1 Tax=Sandaracinus amylolyticus TaxID=927083 RepID=UPI001F382964|nr:hypothetical protein [Sandaracinus amylolyticus]UJR82851.1 Hypothetical protein I5071_49160 [Sandaracinus amylolyticus]